MPKSKVFSRVKPFLAVLFLQFGLAGMDVISKVALDQMMSTYVFVVYYHAIATILTAPLKSEAKDDKSNVWKVYSSCLTRTFSRNLFQYIYLVSGRLEKVKLKSIRSQAKIGGTLTTIGGAMLMTFVKGPVIHLMCTEGRTNPVQRSNGVGYQHSLRGSLMITASCFSWACFMVLQANTLETYPAELSLTAWICLMGTVEGAVLALVMERGNAAVWSLNFDAKLLAAVYSGIICSGLAYYVQGIAMKDRGPVFVTAFNPLGMILVAVLGSFILAEQIHLGGVIGAFVIAVGVYLVVWGKSKDYKPRDLSIDNENALKSEQIIDVSRMNDEENHKVSEQMIEASRIYDKDHHEVLAISESMEEEKESDKTLVN
ncbi:WAT1-related protein At2g37450 [Daucus carota subsp. sativus]|uniref:WAT1-related protein At2g37450 n=1 Tax=Daucus carota subsp. sativus TaxID=79200 RepID=UPI003082C944